MSDVDFLSIPEWFSGKNIFITGGSGFIGKILIEKLLRSCPQIGTIYILIRSKKGKSGAERVQELIDTPVRNKTKTSFSFANFQFQFSVIRCPKTQRS